MVASIGLPGIVTFSAMLIIVQIIWRVVSIKLSETPLGQAMAFIN